MNRRRFLGLTLGGGLAPIRFFSFTHGSPLLASPAEVAVQFRKPHPYEALFRHVSPGEDEFALEKHAVEITSLLEQLIPEKSVPLAEGFRGASPLFARYARVAPDVYEADFDVSNRSFSGGLRQWLRNLGTVRESRFFVTDIQEQDSGSLQVEIRYEIASRVESELQYRVGRWKQTWSNGRLAGFEPLEEVLVTASRPWFTDITAEVFANAESFPEQLLRGVPYWRACLDPATGIDVYGMNGIAVGDLDNDGWDEIYVCQPGGLPNRLYKNRGDGTMTDITDEAGLGVLDDTACALFLDLRNRGLQDLVVLCSNGPLLFLNQGGGQFQFKPDAFDFARAPQGTFTGMAAADYDRDGHLDLYLCSYIYFQSEEQYRYPAPYQDATNGPPNFLFQNRLEPDGSGVFKDAPQRQGSIRIMIGTVLRPPGVTTTETGGRTCT